MSQRHTMIDIGFDTAETLSRRLPVLWWGMVSPTPAGNAEITRMVVEKQMAVLDSVVAMQTELFKAAFVPWWSWTAQSHAQAADDMFQAAIRPAALRVKANARRLRHR
jgi:hypothetical protein